MVGKNLWITGSLATSFVSLIAISWFVIRIPESIQYYATGPAPFRKIYIIPHNSISSKVGIELIIHAGELDNDYPQGLPHYAEHLIWINMSGGKTKDSLAHSNAWTNMTATGYFFNSTQDAWRADLKKLFKVFDQIEVAEDYALEELGIIEREHDQGITENSATARSVEFWADVYDGTPWSRSVIGTRESIQAMTLDQAKAFHREFYHPENASLIVHGNISERQLRSAIEEFAPKRTSDTVPRPLSSYPIPKEQGRDIGRFENTIGLTDPIVWRYAASPASTCSDRVACIMHAWLIEELLESSLEGGLAGPLRFDTFVARAFDVDVSWTIHNQFEVMISATADTGVTSDALLEAIETALLDAAESGISQTVFARIHHRVEDDIPDPDDYEEHFWEVKWSLIDRLDPIPTQAYRSALGAIGQADLNATLKQIADPDRTVIRFGQPN